MSTKHPAHGHRLKPISLHIDPNESVDFGSQRREDVPERLGRFIEENRGKFLALLAATGLTISGISLDHLGKKEVTSDVAAFANHSYNYDDLMAIFKKSPAELRAMVEKGGNGSARYYACCEIVLAFKEGSPKGRQELIAKHPWLHQYAETLK